MSTAKPILSGVNPGASNEDVVLRQPIIMLFQGPSLIDPRSFGSNTFALYGPGDVVYDEGPGTVLNNSVQTDPYKLIDNAIIRERIPGDFELYISGVSGLESLAPSGNIGVSGTLVWAQFTPSVPLKPSTKYEAVIVGDDLASGYLEGSGRYLGVTSWTSEANFTQSGTFSSGIAKVLTSYDRILPTNIYNSATGYNDTYTLTITSGNTIGAPAFAWQKTSTPGVYYGGGAGIHDLGDNLTFEFSGTTITGQTYALDVYIPFPLEKTFVWGFSTAELDANKPPEVVKPDPVIIDATGGNLTLTPISGSIEPLRVVNTWPQDKEYAVVSGLPLIVLEFNKVLDPYLVTSGIISTEHFPIQLSPLMGMPNINVANAVTYPNFLEVSGKYLKLWM